MSTPLLDGDNIVNATLAVPLQPEDQFHTFLSQEDYERFGFICLFIINPIICTFGLVTNILGIAVLWQDTKQQKMSIYFYLCALTIADALYLALGLIRIIPEILMQYDIEMAKYINAVAKPAVIYLDMVFAHTASAMIIVMSFERLLALVKPMTVKYTWFAKYPTKIILVCILFNILFLMPYPINFEVVSFQSGNETEYSLRFREDVNALMRNYMTVQKIIDNFIPVIILLGTNLAIPIKYYLISKRRLTAFNLTSGQTRQQMKITSTVFAVTFLYMLLQIPMMITMLVPYFDPEYSFDGEKKLVFWFFVDLGNVFTYVNAANDFLIYILVSRHYRSVFKLKYCAYCSRESLYETDTDVSVTGPVGSVGSIATISTYNRQLQL